LTSTSIGEGQTAFWAGSAVDLEGNLDLTYRWEFGDGIAATGKNASHAYVDNGVYNVDLFVTDHLGATGVVTFPVTVKTKLPW
jgi:PKD repeat protein